MYVCLYVFIYIENNFFSHTIQNISMAVSPLSPPPSSPPLSSPPDSHAFNFVYFSLFQTGIPRSYGVSPGTHSDQAGLDLIEIRLPLPPE